MFLGLRFIHNCNVNYWLILVVEMSSKELFYWGVGWGATSWTFFLFAKDYLSMHSVSTVSPPRANKNYVRAAGELVHDACVCCRMVVIVLSAGWRGGIHFCTQEQPLQKYCKHRQNKTFVNNTGPAVTHSLQVVKKWGDFTLCLPS